jgi:hypothetical protein
MEPRWKQRNGAGVVGDFRCLSRSGKGASGCYGGKQRQALAGSGREAESFMRMHIKHGLDDPFHLTMINGLCFGWGRYQWASIL